MLVVVSLFISSVFAFQSDFISYCYGEAGSASYKMEIDKDGTMDFFSAGEREISLGKAKLDLDSEQQAYGYQETISQAIHLVTSESEEIYSLGKVTSIVTTARAMVSRIYMYGLRPSGDRFFIDFHCYPRQD